MNRSTMVEEPPILNDEDEKILDKVWASLPPEKPAEPATPKKELQPAPRK